MRAIDQHVETAVMVERCPAYLGWPVIQCKIGQHNQRITRGDLAQPPRFQQFFEGTCSEGERDPFARQRDRDCPPNAAPGASYQRNPFPSYACHKNAEPPRLCTAPFLGSLTSAGATIEPDWPSR